MKNRILYLVSVLTVAMGLTLTSCEDYFDTIPDEIITLDDTFRTKSLTIGYLANIYQYLPDEHNQRFGGSSNTAGIWTGACSEAEYVWDFVKSQEVNNGALNATSSWENIWWIAYYKGITKANTFLQRCMENKEIDPDDLKQYYYEAKALRAIYSFYIFKIYGPFVIREDVIEPDASKEAMNLPRNSVDECVEWIDSELADCIDNLRAGGSTTDESKDVGHITKEIAQVVRTQLWLYAASPLFNGNTFYSECKNKDGKQLFPQTVDNTKWQKARDLTKEWLDRWDGTFVLTMVDKTGKATTDYKLCEPYLSLRAEEYQNNGAAGKSKEDIFVRNNGSESTFYYEMTPYHNGASSDYKGGSGKDATQEMVDLYFMSDGSRIDDSEDYAEFEYGPQPDGSNTYPGEDDIYDYYTLDEKYKEPIFGVSTFIDGKRTVMGQYFNREPRFYADITFNNQKWLSSTVIYTGLARDGNSGIDVAQHDYSHTGYVIRKGCTPNSWGGSSGIIVYTRLAEIYLNYAETLAECANAGIGGADQYQTALQYVNRVRARAGIPGYAFADNTKDLRGMTCIRINNDYKSVISVIRRERAVELAYENHRYFDVRRWKISTMEQGDGWVYPAYHKGGEGGDYWGLTPTAKEFDGFYKKSVFETRVMSERMNLLPIPQADIDRSDKMVQNTGWTSIE